MLRSSLAPLSGPAAMLGGVLALAWILLQVSVVESSRGQTESLAVSGPSLYMLLALLVGAAFLLLAIGLMGLYDRLTRPGRWARVGLVLTHVLVVMAVVYIVLSGVAALGAGAFVPLAWTALMLADLSLHVGLLTLGVATVREGGWRWRLLPLVLGVLGILALVGEQVEALGLVLIVLFGLGWVLLGYALWIERRETATRPSGVA